MNCPLSFALEKLQLPNGKRFYVANQDLVQKNGQGIMSWELAMDGCKKFGAGWLLPNLEEIEEIYNRRGVINNLELTGAWYWSSVQRNDEFEKNKAYALSMNSGFTQSVSKNSQFYARCIKRSYSGK